MSFRFDFSLFPRSAPVRYRIPGWLTTCFAAAFLTVGPTGAGAQLPSVRGERTIIAIPDAFPEVEARAVLLRTGERDVVLLRASEATPEALLMSLSVLGRLPERAPERGQAQMIPITGYVVTGEPSAVVRQRLETTLATLEEAPTTSLGSLGPGRWVSYRPR